MTSSITVIKPDSGARCQRTRAKTLWLTFKKEVDLVHPFPVVFKAAGGELEEERGNNSVIIIMHLYFLIFHLRG